MPDQILHNSQTDRLITKDQDFHGRRVRNASDAILNQDYVTLQQLNKAIKGIKSQTVSVGTSITSRTYSLFKNGTLAIQSDCCPRIFILEALTPTTVRCDVKAAPVGADLIIDILQTSTSWVTITVSAGTTTGSATSVSGLAVNNYFRVDITQVGTINPGADLTVTIG